MRPTALLQESISPHTPCKNPAWWTVSCPTDLHLIPLPAPAVTSRPADRPSVSPALSDSPGKSLCGLQREGGPADYLLSMCSRSAGSSRPLLCCLHTEKGCQRCVMFRSASSGLARRDSGRDTGQMRKNTAPLSQIRILSPSLVSRSCFETLPLVLYRFRASARPGGEGGGEGGARASLAGGQIILPRPAGSCFHKSLNPE